MVNHVDVECSGWPWNGGLEGGGVSFNTVPPLVLISRHVSRNACVSVRDPEDISARWGVRATHEGPTNVRRWRIARHPQEVLWLVISALPSQKKTPEMTGVLRGSPQGEV